MTFYEWLLHEVLADPQRNKLWAQFRREWQITFEQRLESLPGLFKHYQQRFETRPLDELQGLVDEVRGRERVEYRRKKEHNARVQQRQEKAEKRALNTEEQTYYRVEDDVSRVVCADNDPGFDKTGMPCFEGDHAGRDTELKGYYAIHVGDAEEWIPVLMRDGYCDNKYAYVYTIKTSELARTRTPFYSFGEDYHIMDMTNTPGSDIIFSKLKVIPPQYVILDEVIDLSNVKPAQDLY